MSGLLIAAAAYEASSLCFDVLGSYYHKNAVYQNTFKLSGLKQQSMMSIFTGPVHLSWAGPISRCRALHSRP